MSSTSIFARALDGVQTLAYSMRVGVPEDLAMILPLSRGAIAPSPSHAKPLKMHRVGAFDASVVYGRTPVGPSDILGVPLTLVP